jgi:hypothetical protein
VNAFIALKGNKMFPNRIRNEVFSSWNFARVEFAEHQSKQMLLPIKLFKMEKLYFAAKYK